MIKALNHSLYRLWWSLFSKFGISFYFAKLHIFNTINISPNKSILLLPNHFSWWDGFIAYRLSDILFKKTFYVMMLYKNLKVNRVLRGAGAFSIEKNSKRMFETFAYTKELLTNPNNMVTIFPQGIIQSVHDKEIIFESGVQKILKRNESPVQIVLLATLIDYLDKPKPTIFAFTKLYEGEIHLLHEAFIVHYETSKLELAAYVKAKMA
jgi:1-acyl-sn-glycerol-3-phosphate acyltransferase